LEEALEGTNKNAVTGLGSATAFLNIEMLIQTGRVDLLKRNILTPVKQIAY
jgi:hypothetical protein